MSDPVDAVLAAAICRVDPLGLYRAGYEERQKMTTAERIAERTWERTQDRLDEIDSLRQLLELADSEIDDAECALGIATAERERVAVRLTALGVDVDPDLR